MVYKTVEVKSILEKVQVDSPLNCEYSVFPYVGCEYDCIYCPMFAQKNIPIKTCSARRIEVKINAPAVMKKELKTLKRGLICIHGYWPGEKEFRLTRKVLEVLAKRNFPVHIVTRSNMILDDLNLLSKMSDGPLVVSIVANTMQREITDIFEPKAPYPKKRLEALGKLSGCGITAGLVLSPVIPHITDSMEQLSEIIREAQAQKASYVLPVVLKLRDEYRSHVISAVKKYHPNLLSKYKTLYEFGPNPDARYSRRLLRTVNSILKEYNLSGSIPSFKPEESVTQLQIDRFF